MTDTRNTARAEHLSYPDLISIRAELDAALSGHLPEGERTLATAQFNLIDAEITRRDQQSPDLDDGGAGGQQPRPARSTLEHVARSYTAVLSDPGLTGLPDQVRTAMRNRLDEVNRQLTALIKTRRCQVSTGPDQVCGMVLDSSGQCLDQAHRQGRSGNPG